MKDKHKILVVYHGSCADGFTAAWVAKNALKAQYLGVEVEFHAGYYGKEPPDVTSKEVYLLDFSYKREVMKQLIKKSHSLVIIDHHKSAIEDLKGLTEEVGTEVNGEYTGKYYEFLDASKSGAYLTYDYFWKPVNLTNLEGYEASIPELVKRVSDRDLWQFKIPHNKEFHMGLFSYEYTFENWDYISTHIPELIAEGKAILRKHLKDINELIVHTLHWETLAGHSVPVLNVPYMHGSDAASMLLELFPEAPFTGYYYFKNNAKVYGLRSTDSRIDVAKIAEQFGGGGHRNASGFTVKQGISVE